jgi:hypothetical protein
MGTSKEFQPAKEKDLWIGESGLKILRLWKKNRMLSLSSKEGRDKCLARNIEQQSNWGAEYSAGAGSRPDGPPEISQWVWEAEVRTWQDNLCRAVKTGRIFEYHFTGCLVTVPLLSGDFKKMIKLHFIIFICF